MDIDYERIMDDCQQLSAVLDMNLEEKPDDQELKELREFLSDRYKSLLFLTGG